jgi:hypothetical protein
MPRAYHGEESQYKERAPGRCDQRQRFGDVPRSAPGTFQPQRSQRAISVGNCRAVWADVRVSMGLCQIPSHVCYPGQDLCHMP